MAQISEQGRIFFDWRLRQDKAKALERDGSSETCPFMQPMAAAIYHCRHYLDQHDGGVTGHQPSKYLLLNLHIIATRDFGEKEENQLRNRRDAFQEGVSYIMDARNLWIKGFYACPLGEPIKRDFSKDCAINQGRNLHDSYHYLAERMGALW